MNDLLKLAVEAHGGLRQWRRFQKIALELSVGGLLWDLKGQTGLFEDATYEADLDQQSATLGRFGAPHVQVRFTPERLSLVGEDGEPLEVRDHPRAAFLGHTMQTPWDRFHAAYFQGYAIWTYATQPFLYAYPGFEVEEIEPWDEGEETWRRLKVVFPSRIATHAREQVSYFGPDGRLRRHDYAVDVLGGATGAHYVDSYADCEGILIPRRRRVYPLNADNTPARETVLVAIDIRAVALKPR